MTNGIYSTSYISKEPFRFPTVWTIFQGNKISFIKFFLRTNKTPSCVLQCLAYQRILKCTFLNPEKCTVLYTLVSFLSFIPCLYHCQGLCSMMRAYVSSVFQVEGLDSFPSSSKWKGVKSKALTFFCSLSSPTFKRLSLCTFAGKYVSQTCLFLGHVCLIRVYGN